MTKLLTARAKRLLVVECVALSFLATSLVALAFSRTYMFHFEQVTLNYYANGSADFTTNVTSLVRSLGTIAIFSLFFGLAMGIAMGLTFYPQIRGQKSASGLTRYEEEMARLGFVVIRKTPEGTTYQLTELGRRFLNDYRFLEKTEETANPDAPLAS